MISQHLESTINKGGMWGAGGIKKSSECSVIMSQIDNAKV